GRERGQEGGRSGGGGDYSWGSGGSDAAGGSVCEVPVPPDGRRECPRCGRQNAVGAAECCYCTGGRKRSGSLNSPAAGDPSKRRATQALVAPSDMAGIGGTRAGVSVQPELTSPVVGAGSFEAGEGVGSVSIEIFGTEGDFPGSVNDHWRCVCHVSNPSDRRTCRECGRIAFWTADLTGIGGTHVWVPTPEGMKTEPLEGAGAGIKAGGSRRGFGDTIDEVDGGGGCSASAESGDGGVGTEWICNAAWYVGDDGMEIVAPAPSSPASGGGGGAGAAPTSSGTAPHAGRTTRSGVSSRAGSAVPGSSNKKKRAAKCGKPVCGVPEGGSGEPVCWACEEPARVLSSRVRWKHYQSEDAINAAKSVWSARIALGADRGRVKDGKEPSNECFCDRTDCMFMKVEQWQREEAVQGQGANRDVVCAICNKGRRSTPQHHHPGAFLYAMRVLFSRRDPLHPQALPLGSTLDENSNLCQACYMRGYRFAQSTKDGSGIQSVDDELTLRSGCQPLQNDSVDGARSLARRRFLEILADGGFVYLAHGVDIYKEARREAGLGPIADKSLADEVRSLFQELSTAVNDAEFCSWSGADVGSRDRRTTRVYLMPTFVAHVEIAKLHESLLAVEKELAECKKIARMYQAKDHAPKR
ncbi:unnamed protein product, partial [Ectocarpus sp. 12 AP-2014]